MAKIEVTDYGTDYIDVYVSELGSSAKYIEFYIDYELDKMYTLTTNSKSHTFDGLDPGTEYTLHALVYNSDWEQLTFANNSVDQTTDSADPIRVFFYDGELSEDTGLTYDSVEAIGPLQNDDWTFVGWATETSSPDVTYEEGDIIKPNSSTTRVNLYAVYEKETKFYCYYIQGSTGNLVSNTRYKKQYRCNTEKHASSTDFYNTVTMPTFSSSNLTITTSDPAREWTAIGWRRDTIADFQHYDAAEVVSTERITGDVYAVYSNQCSLIYNANGGSGTMPTITADAFYNASGNYIKATFSIADSIFTPPSKKQFSHWETSNGNEYYGGDELETSYEVTLYAIWIAGEPDPFKWVSTIGGEITYTRSGNTITCTPLTAAEWKTFIDRIFEWLEYCNVSTSMTASSLYVTKGTVMKASVVESAKNLIDLMDPEEPVPNAVSTGSPITAAYINGLADSINSHKQILD